MDAAPEPRPDPFHGLPWDRATLVEFCRRVGNTVDTCDFGSIRAAETMADAIQAARDTAPPPVRFPGLPATREGLMVFFHRVTSQHPLADFNSQRASRALVDALMEAAAPPPRMRKPPAPWTARRQPDGAVVLLDGDRVIGAVLPGPHGIEPWEADHLALAPRMRATLTQLMDGPWQRDAWDEAAALLVALGMRMPPR